MDLVNSRELAPVDAVPESVASKDDLKLDPELSYAGAESARKRRTDIACVCAVAAAVVHPQSAEDTCVVHQEAEAEPDEPDRCGFAKTTGFSSNVGIVRAGLFAQYHGRSIAVPRDAKVRGPPRGS